MTRRELFGHLFSLPLVGGLAVLSAKALDKKEDEAVDDWYVTTTARDCAYRLEPSTTRLVVTEASQDDYISMDGKNWRTSHYRYSGKTGKTTYLGDW